MLKVLFNKIVAPRLVQRAITRSYYVPKIHNNNHHHHCVVMLIGDSKNDIDEASTEIKQIIENIGTDVDIISNLNGLVDKMEEPKHNIIINKCYNLKDHQIKPLELFIRNDVWSSFFIYACKNVFNNNNKNIGVPVYALNSSIHDKRNDINSYFKQF